MFLSVYDKCRYRTISIDAFNRDPLKCKCGNYMVYTSTYNPLKGGRNDRVYREACINEMQRMRIRGKVPLWLLLELNSNPKRIKKMMCPQ